MNHQPSRERDRFVPNRDGAPEDVRRVSPGTSGARLRLVAPVVAFAAALALRLPLMNEGLFHHDEVRLARAVERSLDQRRILPTVKSRYGAVVLALAAYAPYHALTGRSAERSVPFVGIAAGALLVLAILLLAGELTGDAVAGPLAAAFTACGTLFLTSSSTGKENTPQVAFATLAVWLLARAARTGSRSSRIAAWATFAFSLTIHEGGILLAPAVAIAAVLLAVRRGRGTRWVVVDFVAVTSAATFAVWLSIWEELQRNLFVPGANSATFLGLASPFLPVALVDVPAAFGVPVLVLAAIGSVLALARIRTGSSISVVPWLLVILYFGNVNSYAPRYLLYVLTPITVLAAAGAAHLVRLAPRRLVPAAAVVLAIAAGAPGVARAWPMLARRAASSGPKTMALFVARATEPGAVVLCQDDSPHLEYYAPGRTLLSQPVADLPGTAALVHDLVKRARAGAPIYAATHAFAYDDGGHFARLLNGAFEAVPVGAVMNESFHRSELRSMTFDDVLFRLQLR